MTRKGSEVRVLYGPLCGTEKGQVAGTARGGRSADKSVLRGSWNTGELRSVLLGSAQLSACPSSGVIPGGPDAVAARCTPSRSRHLRAVDLDSAVRWATLFSGISGQGMTRRCGSFGREVGATRRLLRPRVGTRHAQKQVEVMLALNEQSPARLCTCRALIWVHLVKAAEYEGGVSEHRQCSPEFRLGPLVSARCR